MATTAPVPRSQMLPAVITGMMKELMPDIRNLLPPDIEYDQFRAALWLELTGNRQLKECTMESIRAGAIKAATYGLLPGKYCHLLPFKNKGRLEATFVSNYFGVLLTLERSGKVAKAFAHPVYEGDEFVMDFFANQYKHIPYMVRGTEPGAVLFYYGAVILKDGTVNVEALSLKQIEAIRRKAPAHDQGPWVTHEVEMARKTALKRVAKFVHLTPQQEQLLREDDARELTDIPHERHVKNITDLFGDGAIDVTPSRPEDQPLWMDTLKAHWQEVPEPLRSQVQAVVDGTHEVSYAEGEALSSAVLDWLEKGREPGEEG